MGRKLCLITFTLFLSCAGRNSKTAPAFEQAKYTPFTRYNENSDWTILDYDGKNAGRTLPTWFRAWQEGGEQEIEKISTYSNYYCFIIEQSGSNLAVLQRWASALDIERGVARAVTRRVFKRWVVNIDKPPDIVYGHYFETLLLTLSARRWSGARRESARWIFVNHNDSPADAASPPSSGDVYRMVIFAVIDREEFKRTMQEVFNSVPTGEEKHKIDIVAELTNNNKSLMRTRSSSVSRAVRRAQNAACEQLISQFWKNF